MSTVTFTVLGVPRPGGSKRAVPAKGGRFAYVIPDNAKTKPWMTAVAAVARDAYSGPLLTGPIEVEARFYLIRPKCHYRTGKFNGVLKDTAPKRPIVIPDLTKLWRSTEDALKGILWRDDSQVVKATLSKHYGEPARAEVDVRYEETT